MDDQTQHDLIDGGLKEVDRLNHMLSNLLDMSRIEAGSLMLSLEIVDIKDLIKAALEQVGNRHGIHSVNINLPDNLPYLLVDSGLMVQAFINILDNSFKYSPPESGVDINADTLVSKLKLPSLIMDQEFRLRYQTCI